MATRPGSPTAIHGQMSVWSSVSTRAGLAHVRPPFVEYEYHTPAARLPLPLSSHVAYTLPLASVSIAGQWDSMLTPSAIVDISGVRATAATGSSACRNAAMDSAPPP